MKLGDLEISSAAGMTELSLTGCRTRQQAEERVRAWLLQSWQDGMRKLARDLFLADEVDNSSIEDILNAADARRDEAIEGAVKDVHRILDGVFGPGGCCIH